MSLRDKKTGRWLTGSLAKATSDEQYNLIMSTVPKVKGCAATSLADFGYAYVKVPAVAGATTTTAAQQGDEPSSEGDTGDYKTVLRTIHDPSKGFQWLGQKHYDLLGNAIVSEIYSKMEAPEIGLSRIMVPLAKGEAEALLGGEHTTKPTAADEAYTEEDSSSAVASAPPPATDEAAVEEAPSSSAVKKTARKEPQVPIFMSPDALTADTLLLIMQGTGAVRPGMWARALCMNESLEDGTIFSYIAKAKQRGWGVIVTNPNENTVPVMDAAAASDDGQNMSTEDYWLGTDDTKWKAFARKINLSSEAVRESGSSQDHSQYVYETLVIPSKAKRVLIVAHSFGGICTGSLFRDKAPIRAHLLRKCPAVAFTDACNDVRSNDLPEIRNFYKNNVINWVASRKPLNASVGVHRLSGCEERSAGHEAHEWTSSKCVTPLFEWLDEKLAASLKK